MEYIPLMGREKSSFTSFVEKLESPYIQISEEEATIHSHKIRVDAKERLNALIHDYPQPDYIHDKYSGINTPKIGDEINGARVDSITPNGVALTLTSDGYKSIKLADLVDIHHEAKKRGFLIKNDGVDLLLKVNEANSLVDNYAYNYNITKESRDGVEYYRVPNEFDEKLESSFLNKIGTIFTPKNEDKKNMVDEKEDFKTIIRKNR